MKTDYPSHWPNRFGPASNWLHGQLEQLGLTLESRWEQHAAEPELEPLTLTTEPEELEAWLDEVKGTESVPYDGPPRVTWDEI